MYDWIYRKNWPGWRDVRAHICTITITFAFTNVWKVPRDGFRFGGASYGLLLTLAMLLVGLPVAFLQLSIGQLSQQDPVGVWRAVPFFRGLGYLRLLISCLACTYTVLYTALSAAYFFNTLGNGIPFPECLYYSSSGNLSSLNGLQCLEETFMSPLAVNPEYYVALAFIVIVLWISFPFLLFSPHKFMKRIFYLLGPVVIILMIAIFIYLGDKSNLSHFLNEEWGQLLDPYIWHAAITQSLISTHTAGGGLISFGDTVYHNMNVRRSAIALVATNIISVWFSLLFWFSTYSGAEKYNSPAAVIVQTYETAQENQSQSVWPLLTYAMLFCSGVITMLTLLFPLYERFRRRGGARWRLLCFTSSVVGVLITLAILLEGLSAFISIEDVAMPFLISITTVAEVSVFVSIYGWKRVIEDIEFLTSSQLNKCWAYSIRLVPFMILPVWVWWTVASTTGGGVGWGQPPWQNIAICASAGCGVCVVLAVAAAAVFSQTQLKMIAKLQSSFRPARRWGPRDPITHHYWLARQEESQRHHREGSSASGDLELDKDGWVQVTPGLDSKEFKEIKFRSNSDDWVYTIYRKEFIQNNNFIKNIRRTKSLDLFLFPTTSLSAPLRAHEVQSDNMSYKSSDSKT